MQPRFTVAPGKRRLLRTLVALLAPFIALALELLLWDAIEPHVGFLFYPAIFISASIGSRRSGLVATATATLLVWWFFLRPAGSVGIDPRHLFAVVVFFTTGVAFVFFHERLGRALTAEGAQKQLQADLREMTELHQEREKLDHERRVFAALIENSPDFIGIADAGGKPTYLNPAGRRMVGLSPDHPIEKTAIAEYYPPAQRAFATDVIVKEMIEHGLWQGETYFRNWRTEEAIPVSDIHFTIRDPGTDQVLGMGTITRDISGMRQVEDELKRANEELSQARNFLENVLESSTEYSIIAKDLDRRILAWNKGAERFYGYDASEVIGRSSEMLHVPEEIQSGAVAELHRRALAQGHATGLFRRRRKDGSEFLARVVMTRRNDSRGNAIGYLVVSHDVTAEQRHLEEQRYLAEVGEALQSSLDYAETVESVAQLPLGFLGDTSTLDVVDESGEVRRMRVVHADPAKAPIADALQRIAPTRDRPHPLWRVLETHQSLLLTEVPADLLRSVAQSEEHLRLLQALGQRSAILVPLIARDRLIAVLSMASCRPERRYGVEDLHLAEELARRASLALDNAHLYEVARTAIQARDRVLAVVAHDLRNPLGAILMAASLLRRRVDAAGPAQKQVDSIERAATRMNRLIGDLLDITRMEAGHLMIEPGRVSAGQTALEAFETQRALAAVASLELRRDLPSDLPDVWADHHRLLQVFENLIGNAVKFTSAGGRVVVGARARDGDVLFWVSDSGPGIAAEDVPHLFDRFWQAEKAGRRGTGLGLPIVKGIVEAHGGRVWVESTRGVGSTFFFTVPTVAAAVTSRQEPAAHGPAH